MNPEKYLNELIKVGSLVVHLPGGKELSVGDGGTPSVAVTITDHTTLAKIAARPSLGLGEAYMDGRLVFEQGTLYDLLELAGRNSVDRPVYRKPGMLRLGWAMAAAEKNPRRAARRNVHHHYDLSHTLYRAFLDADLQYSCAYFENDEMSLEEAQEAKKRHIADKLGLADGQKVLDIGSGWGGLALTLASSADVKVHGVTLSDEQILLSKHRAASIGMANRVTFAQTDYRDLQGRYDRIVSVGMFEHVGRPNYKLYFDKIAELLTDDGVALIHSIGRFTGPSATDYFTAKYIFPGGYIPALSEVLPVVEQSGLKVADIEILRLHYAKTLRSWFNRFQSRRDEMKALYDERFCRMWEFYLAGAEMGFRYGDHMNFQLQLTKRTDALPLTRDYMVGGKIAPRTFASLDERPAMPARAPTPIVEPVAEPEPAEPALVTPSPAAEAAEPAAVEVVAAPVQLVPKRPAPTKTVPAKKAAKAPKSAAVTAAKAEPAAPLPKASAATAKAAPAKASPLAKAKTAAPKAAPATTDKAAPAKAPPVAKAKTTAPKADPAPAAKPAATKPAAAKPAAKPAPPAKPAAARKPKR